MTDLKQTERDPLVSVVMVTYKEVPEKLVRSVDSILVQTLSDLELIIVFEKGDPNQELLKQKYDDERIVYIENQGQRHRNIAHNLGLSVARGQYLARLDSDDWTTPDRLEIEVEYLRSHPDIVLVGSAGRLLECGKEVGVRVFPKTHEEIMRSIAFTTPLFHSSIMWDRDRVGHDMRYSMHKLDDLELYLQMVQRGFRLANLEAVLIDYDQPIAYKRSIYAYRDAFSVRAKHWRVCFKYPYFAVGILARGILAILPHWVSRNLTARNPVSDWFRSIRVT